MLYDYSMVQDVCYSESDSSLTLSYQGALEKVQDSITYYFRSFGGDNKTVLQHDKAVWVIVRSRILFSRRPEWLEMLHAYSYTSLLRPFSSHIETIFTDANGKELMKGQVEACPIDIEKRRIRKIADITYPKDMETKPSAFASDFDRTQMDFEEKDIAYSRPVAATDIDYSFHVNNTVYIGYMLNAFSLDELKDLDLKEISITYGKEALYGETLTIYRKDEGKRSWFLIKAGDKELTRAYLERR